ncbi:L,D-transpeptidase family protein [Sphingomonas hankyongi]|uniref:L,D-transpeptidase family protein n=1 Tax=Sphingomonas hankyongi TaxID=2908209 RepID=A0ABT0RZE1_9SPHN|nr:L,D-transpeptidase family protein [Sphingomonas hankyongi]MCL6728969.1 L,D-transpeptidase family protein [Sphingomonas hankyongi]
MRFSKLAILVAALVGLSSAADARLFGLFGGQKPRPQPVARPAHPVAQPVNYRWSLGAAPQAYKDMVAELGTRGLKPGQFVWASAIPTEGETRVVLDLKTQMAYVYRGDRVVGATTISSARTGMVTPLGNWKVLEKRKMYRSKKYDNAPMPFMQRIDEYGIAFHGGNNPGYPASHGCVRMPLKFAEKLFGLTKIGSEVIIEG